MILDESIHDEWLPRTRLGLIPEMMEHGLFASVRMLKVLDSPNEGITYCLQFFAENRDDLNRYMETVHPGVEEKMREEFGSKCLSFTTRMEYIV